MSTEKIIPHNSTPIEKVYFDGIELHILRLDKIHPYISGNKFFKLKYNLLEALNLQQNTVLTFGGAFSNHIAATAYAANLIGLHSIGVIRGDQVSNTTLDFAQKHQMKLFFVDRDTYRHKYDDEVQKQLQDKFGEYFQIPEGGTNELAIKGTAEIMALVPQHYYQIACCVGTAGTIAGLVKASHNEQKILGYPALKGDWVKDEIQQWVEKNNCEVISDYHFGGYAKWKPELIEFINDFKRQTGIPLDPIYTGKMFYGVIDLIKKEKLLNTGLLLIHSGGLQGISGFNNRFGPLIET